MMFYIKYEGTGTCSLRQRKLKIVFTEHLSLTGQPLSLNFKMQKAIYTRYIQG